MGAVVPVRGDLFASETSLGHCISQDCHLRKGVAGQIRRFFGNVQEIKAQNRRVGQVAITKIPGSIQGFPRYVFHLVTKRYFWQKPSVSTLAQALTSLKYHLMEMEINQVSVPWLGAGRDRLSKSEVWNLLNTIFTGSGITVYVYSLE